MVQNGRNIKMFVTIKSDTLRADQIRSVEVYDKQILIYFIRDKMNMRYFFENNEKRNTTYKEIIRQWKKALEQQ